jgi:hypothetical protein
MIYDIITPRSGLYSLPCLHTTTVQLFADRTSARVPPLPRKLLPRHRRVDCRPALVFLLRTVCRPSRWQVLLFEVCAVPGSNSLKSPLRIPLRKPKSTGELLLPPREPIPRYCAADHRPPLVFPLCTACRLFCWGVPLVEAGTVPEFECCSGFSGSQSSARSFQSS